ncbi:MAG: cytochrome c oxidase subunit II [Chloroflexota bacterium]
MKHFIVVAIIVILFTFLVYTGLNSIGLLPVQASAQSVSIDNLFQIHVGLISFLFALIISILVYSLIVFRRKKGETGDGAHIVGNSTLEIAWSIIPLFIVIFLAYMGAYSLGEVRRIDMSALQVKVTAGQWYWQFQYPEYGVTSTELYLPVNRQVDLQMSSNDVIHSFWVPEFRVKQDIVPGQVTELRITPTLLGNYKVLCAELCGASHAYMEGLVMVVDLPTFENWIANQQATVEVDPVLKGQQLVQQYGCTTCHSLDGSIKIGPSWKELYESTVTLDDGSTIFADQAYLTSSILEPNLYVHEGFPSNVMPSFNEILDQTQVESIVAFIESLK